MAGRSSVRVHARLAWFICTLSVALMASAVVFRFLARSAEAPLDLGTWQVAAGYAAAGLVVPALGALISSRRPENPIGWIFCAIGLATGLEYAAEGYAVYALFGDGSAAPGGVWAAWAADWVWTFSIGLLPFVFLLFPNGRLPSRRWRPVAFFAAALYVALPVGYALLPGSLGSFPSIENPMGYGGAEDEILPGVNQALVWIALVLTVLLSVVSLMLRFRRAVGVERQQIKWVAYTAVLLITYALVDLFFQDVITPVAPVLDAVFVGSFYAAIAVAILKHRLYDIDVIINRTLVYGILTATLALVYFGSVVLLQRAFVLLTGETSQLTVVASTLAIAALFNPLRWRVQAFVDRRFYRRKYDARKTLEEFSARLRDETDLGALNDELVEVVRDTVQPAHVSLWLRTADRTRNPDSRGEPEASG